MNRIAVITALILAVLTSVGCDPYEVDEVLMQKENVSLVIKGTVMFDYDGYTGQMSYNHKRNEYRVMDDDMAHYFFLRFDADLSDVGQEVGAILKYTTLSNVREEKNLTFRVEKTDPSSGMFWLWCQSKKIGVVVRKF